VSLRLRASTAQSDSHEFSRLSGMRGRLSHCQRLAPGNAELGSLPVAGARPAGRPGGSDSEPESTPGHLSLLSWLQVSCRIVPNRSHIIFKFVVKIVTRM
jgi:hypothetical protein